MSMLLMCTVGWRLNYESITFIMDHPTSGVLRGAANGIGRCCEGRLNIKKEILIMIFEPKTRTEWYMAKFADNSIEVPADIWPPKTNKEIYWAGMAGLHDSLLPLP